MGTTFANASVGTISAIVNNIQVMFAVLSMNPDMSLGHWLLGIADCWRQRGTAVYRFGNGSRTDGPGEGQVHFLRASQVGTGHPAGLRHVYPDAHVDQFRVFPSAPLAG